MTKLFMTAISTIGNDTSPHRPSLWAKLVVGKDKKEVETKLIQFELEGDRLPQRIYVEEVTVKELEDYLKQLKGGQS